LRYARKLDFFETPDYDYCHNLFKAVLERMGHTYDYDFDWTAKLNQATTPSGSLHTGMESSKIKWEKGESADRRVRTAGRNEKDEMLKTSKQTSGQGASTAAVHQGGGFGSTQVINSNAGDIIEEGGNTQQPAARDDDDQGEVKCCCFRRRRRKVPHDVTNLDIYGGAPRQHETR